MITSEIMLWMVVVTLWMPASTRSPIQGAGTVGVTVDYLDAWASVCDTCGARCGVFDVL